MLSEAKSQVLLLQPWIEDFYATECRMQPLGLAYLAGSLKRKFPEINVQIYDTFAGGKKKNLSWPKEFEYLKPYYGYPDHSPFSLFYHYSRFGQSADTIEKKLHAYAPFLIGISCLFTPYYRQSLALARLCKKVFPQVPIVMGGSHATLRPQSLLSPQPPFDPGEHLCDYVLRGEAEESICELVEFLQGKRLLSSVSNLVDLQARSRKRERRHQTGNGDKELKLSAPVPPDRRQLAFPDFTGLNPKHYTFQGLPLSFIITSRSCRHRCSFCTVHAVFGAHYETRDPGDVVAEIQLRYKQGFRHFDIEDDNFTSDKKHCLEILNRIADLQLPISFSAMNGLCYWTLDHDILRALRKNGFDTLNLSLVSSEERGKLFNRPTHSPKKLQEIVQAAQQLGLRVIAYAILGMPGQTPEEMCASLRVLAAAKCLVGVSPFYFTPGSPIYQKEKHNPEIRLASQGKDAFLSARLSALDIEHHNFSRDDVYTCFRMARVINYIKEGLDRNLEQTDSWFEPAFKVIREGKWHAESKEGRQALPFSKKIHSLLVQKPLEVQGYKSSRKLIFTEPKVIGI
jgi:radical SAM superfamily enzyme YgiQ (UPF0313 family)